MQGQCDGPAPAAFGLTESRPAGACAVLVEEDFLDIPLGTGPQGSGLLLQRLYVAVASPAGSGSSVLLLHVRPSPPSLSPLCMHCMHDTERLLDLRSICCFTLMSV